MQQVTSAIPTQAQTLHPAWDPQNLTDAFGQSLGRLYASFVLLAVMSIGAFVSALIGILSR